MNNLPALVRGAPGARPKKKGSARAASVTPAEEAISAYFFVSLETFAHEPFASSHCFKCISLLRIALELPQLFWKWSNHPI